MEITKSLLQSLVLDQNKSLSEIAKITGKNVGFISRKAKQFGIVSKHIGKIASRKFPIDLIYEKYIGGDSLHKLKSEYKTSVQCLKRHLKKAYPGINFRSMDQAKRPDQLNDQNYLILKAEGNKTVKEISKELGVKESTVLSAYRRMHIDRYVNESVAISKDDLQRLYWDEMKSSVEIGKMYGISAPYVINKLMQCRIPIRGFRETSESKHDQLNEKLWLIEEYEEKRRSMSDISLELGTSIGNISHYLRKYNIAIRSREEIINDITGNGQKGEFLFNSVPIQCDSLLEKAFLSKLPSSSNVKRGCQMTYDDVSCVIDFEVDNELVEVKSKSESIDPGVNRQRLIKQIKVAEKCGYDVKVWNGSYVNIDIIDIDIYYSSNWKLFFDGSNSCFEWLLEYGFHGAKHNRGKLIRAISDYKNYDGDSDKGLNANIANSAILSVITSFSDHFYYSSHKDYNSISSAWEIGNTIVLKNAVERLWNENKNINIYGLVKTIGKWYKDFSPVSVFKPWVASYIYDRYISGNGVVIDPCMGWGGRLLGCLNKNIKYFGYDLNENSVSANSEMARFMKYRLGETNIKQADSSKYDFPDGDLLLTSPPYDDTEYYHGINSCDTKTEPILNNIFEKFNGIIALNLPKRQEKLCMEIAYSHGFKLHERLEMKTASFMGREKTYEPILIFK